MPTPAISQLTTRIKHYRTVLTRLAACGAVMGLVACSTPVSDPGRELLPPDDTSPAIPAYDARLEALLAEAARLPSPESEARYMEGAGILLERGYPDEALTILSLIQYDNLPRQLRTDAMLLRAELLVANNRAGEALPLLTSEELASLPAFDAETQLKLRNLRAQSFYASGQYLLSAQERIFMDSQLGELDQFDNHEVIWQTLMQLDSRRLAELTRSSIAYEFQGWYELALIGKSWQFNLDRQQVELDRWLESWQRHPAANSLPTQLQSVANVSQNRPETVALLLPLQSLAGRVVRDGFMSAWYNAREVGVDVPEIRLYDTSVNADIPALHARARSEGAQMIIGPLLRPQVEQLANVGFLGVPTLVLNTLDGSFNTPRQLYQFSLSPDNEIRQLAEHAWEKGYRNVAILSPYEASETYYSRKRETFRRTWQALGGQVVSEELFTDNYTSVIENLLAITSSEARMGSLSNLLNTNLQFTPRRRKDIDFILLMADPGAARQIKPSLAYLFAGDIPVLATQDVYAGRPQPQLDNDLNGIIFSDSPWLLTSQDDTREETRTLFPQPNATLSRIQAFGVDAFRLHPRLQQLQAEPEAIMFGATGQLKMNENRVISQEFNWARFENGLAVPE